MRASRVSVLLMLLLFASFYFVSAPAMLAIEYPWDRDDGGNVGNDGSGGGDDGGDADTVIVRSQPATTSYDQPDERDWFDRIARVLMLWYLGVYNTEITSSIW